MSEISETSSSAISTYIDNKTNDGYSIKFTLANINFSMANALRRVILTDIPIVAFKTFPHEENLSVFHTNTTRLNNEILRQRLECIPVYIKDPEINLDELEVEINVKNIGNIMRTVTTKDFKIKDLKTDRYLADNVRDSIFPPDNITGDHIIFCRLRPKISNEVNGEELHITSKLSIQTAADSGAYNSASACSYSYTPDKMKQDTEWQKRITSLSEEEKDPENLMFLEQDWRNHGSQRFYKDNYFDFIIESIGVYTGYELVSKACEIMISKLQIFYEKAGASSIEITQADSTMPWSLDIKLENESYTLGKVIEYTMNKKFYTEGKLLTFIGFRQEHPHDTDSFIRVAFDPKSAEDTPSYDKFKTACLTLIQSACTDSIEIFREIASEFN
jgi:DNA-directed RNA polymerase subunit L